MQNAVLDEAQAGIKTAGRNINNLRYAHDTTLMAESKVELKSLLMKVKEESEKPGLKLNIQKTSRGDAITVELLSPCLFDLYTEYITQNARLDEAQAGIKISGRNINTLRYANDTTVMAESKKELKIPLVKVKKESEKAGLKLNIQKTKIMASGPITSWQIDGETMETVTDFIFGGSKITCRG